MASHLESNLRQYLEQEFDRRKKKNARYSIRSFARDLEIDATALSRILAGTRSISAKIAQRLLSKLKLSPSTRETLLRSLIAPDDHAVPVDSDYLEITEAQMERMDEWIYSAVLELARSQSARLDAPTLSRYFGLSIAKAEKIVKVLTELGLLKKTERGFKKIHDRSTTPFRKNSAARKSVIAGYIDQAKSAMEHHVEESHNISGVTVLVSRDKLPEASRRIKEFRRSLAHFLSTDDGEDLYRINIQLFSLKAKN